MLSNTIILLFASVFLVSASYHYPQQPCSCNCGQCSRSSVSPYGGYGGPTSSAMYGSSSPGMYGSMQYGGSAYGYGMGGGMSSGYGMGGGMYPQGYQNGGYRIKPKTKLGWDHQSGGFRLKTKYKVKPIDGGYPPVYSQTSYGQVPSYVNSHPLAQYGSSGPTFGSSGSGPQYGQQQYGGYGRSPYYSGPNAYHQYGSQQNCNW